jgi:hypothetical protein
MMNTTPDRQEYEEHLREDSTHLSQMRIYSNNSPVIWMENFLIKLKKTFRDLHFDVNIARLLFTVLLSLCIPLILTDPDPEKTWNQKRVEVVTFLSAGVGVLFAMTNLHNQYHYRKLEAASKYIEQWNSEDFHQSRLKLRDVTNEEFYRKHPIAFNEENFNTCHSELIELKGSPDGIETLKLVQSNILYRLLSKKEEAQNVEKILSFFEHMGQDVKCNVADSEYLKDYFYLVVINYYEFLRKYIEYHQFRRCHRLIFSNFVYLAQTWEKAGTPLSLPKICRRPLVLTSSDLCEAKSRSVV